MAAASIGKATDQSVSIYTLTILLNQGRYTTEATKVRTQKLIKEIRLHLGSHKVTIKN